MGAESRLSLSPCVTAGTPMSLLGAMGSPPIMWAAGDRGLVTLHPTICVSLRKLQGRLPGFKSQLQCFAE